VQVPARVGRAAARAAADDPGLLQRAERAACAWLGDHPHLNPGLSGDLIADRLPPWRQGPAWKFMTQWLDPVGLACFLDTLTRGSPNRRASLTALRGARRGFAHHGLDLDWPIHDHVVGGPGMTHCLAAHDVVHRICTHLTSPVHAAALALTLVSEAQAAVVTSVPISGLSLDASTVTFPPLTSHFLHGNAPPETVRRYHQVYRPLPVTFPVPPAARPPLLAARFLKLLRPARPDDLLLTAAPGPRGRIDATTISALARACGVALPATLHPMGVLWHTAVRCRWQHDADTRTDMHPWHQWTDVPLSGFDP